MENLLVKETEPRLSAYPKVLWQRVKKINRLFAYTVVIPTVIATTYFGLIASDVYISESRFVVRSPQRQSQTGVLGNLLQSTGFSRAQDDTYPVHDYILSRDALAELNKQDAYINAYSHAGADLFSRFPSLDFDKSFEALWRYYQKQVEIDYDSTSGITTLKVRAFTAGGATRINEQLLHMSEQLVNRMNMRASQDMIRFAQEEVSRAESKDKEAALALSSFRKGHAVFDPEKQSGLELQQVAKRQDELSASKTQLAQLEAYTPNNPQIPMLKTRISSLQAEVDAALKGVTGDKGSLSDKAAPYERLELNRAFADKQLASALASLEMARNEAQRQQLYLERLVQPNKPDVAIEPKRFKSIFEVFALGMVVWGVLSLALAGVREHHD